MNHLFDVALGKEKCRFHEEQALSEREQGALVHSVVAFNEAGICKVKSDGEIEKAYWWIKRSYF